MTNLFGQQWQRMELLSHIGNLTQIGGISLSENIEGPERGIRVAAFRSGSGLNFSVLLDRGLDIGAAEYCGKPLAWLSPAGFGQPGLFEPEGIGWLRTFGGGLLTGCGLTNIGAPEIDQGEALGLHGRLSLLQARNVQVGEDWENDECTFWLQGTLRQARLFSENLSLSRRISSRLGENKILIQDWVENLADQPSPLALLYHINIGFPMLDEESYLVSAPHPVRPRDMIAETGLENWHHFQPPTTGYQEQVFYHDLVTDSQGWAEISLINPKLGLELTVKYQKTTLPNLIQWKMMGNGAYVLGLEPSNGFVEGRSKDRERGVLQIIQPGENRLFQVEIRVTEM